MKDYLKNLLREGLIDEVFNSEPLEFVDKTYGDSDYLNYSFTVPNEQGDYTIETSIVIRRYDDPDIIKTSKHLNIPRYKHGAYLYVSFKSLEHGFDTINRGDVLKIISTIKAIVKNAVSKLKQKGLALIMIYSMPISNKGKQTRKDMYSYLYKDLTVNGVFNEFEFGSYSGIYSTVRPRKPRVTNQTNQAKPKVAKSVSAVSSSGGGAGGNIREFIPAKVDTTNEIVSIINQRLESDNTFMHTKINRGDTRPSTIKNYKFTYDYDIEFRTIDGTRTMVEFRDYYPYDEETAQFVKDHKDEFVNLIED